jgi:hypothetical protein
MSVLAGSGFSKQLHDIADGEIAKSFWNCINVVPTGVDEAALAQFLLAAVKEVTANVPDLAVMSNDDMIAEICGKR